LVQHAAGATRIRARVRAFAIGALFGEQGVEAVAVDGVGKALVEGGEVAGCFGAASEAREGFDAQGLALFGEGARGEVELVITSEGESAGGVSGDEALRLLQ